MRKRFKPLDLSPIVNLKNPEIAYCLGIIATDGNLYRYKLGSEKLSIVFQKKDITLLRKIKRALKIENNIVTRKVKKREYVGLYICTPGLIRTFSKWNITPKKSHTIEFPKNLPKNLIRHFIRGCFDGDGTVVFHRRNDRTSYIQTVRLVSGSEKFISGLRNELSNNSIESYISKEKRGGKRKPLYSLTIKANSLKAFYKYIYKNNNIQLTRKKKKFERLLKHRARYSGNKFTFRDEKIKKFYSLEYFKIALQKKKSVVQMAKEGKVHKTTVYKHIKRLKFNYSIE